MPSYPVPAFPLRHPPAFRSVQIPDGISASDFFTRFRIFFFKHGFALFSPLFPGSSCGCPAYGVEDHVLPVLHENPEKTRKNETERRDHGADCADAAAEDSCGDVFRFRCGDQRSEGAAGERECGLAAVPDAETFRMENELLRKQRQQNHDAEYVTRVP